MMLFCTVDKLLIPYRIKFGPWTMVKIIILRSKAMYSTLCSDAATKTGQYVFLHPPTVTIEVKIFETV